MKVYGIKTCGSVKKAFAYLKNKEITYEFIDFKKEMPTQEQIEKWLKAVGMEVLMNTRGTKYKTLGLKNMDLSEQDKIQWMMDEPLIIKRPVIETDQGTVLVGYDEDMYEAAF